MFRQRCLPSSWMLPKSPCSKASGSHRGKGARSGARQVPHQRFSSDFCRVCQLLEGRSRDAWQKPHEVVVAGLGLRPTDMVTDIGAGTGHSARRFENHAAKVYAVDINKQLLAIAQKSAPSEPHHSAGYTTDPRLSDQSSEESWTWNSRVTPLPARFQRFFHSRDRGRGSGRLND